MTGVSWVVATAGDELAGSGLVGASASCDDAGPAAAAGDDDDRAK